MKKWAKFNGPEEDSSQKKITSFFKSNNDKASGDNVGGQKLITDYFRGSSTNNATTSGSTGNIYNKSESRKTLKSLKHSGQVEIVDLADSDGEDLYCVLSGMGKQYDIKACEGSLTTAYTKVPVFVQPFKSELTSSTGCSGQDDRRPEDDNLHFICKTLIKKEELLMTSLNTDDDSDQNLRSNSSVETNLPEPDGQEDTNEGRIRLVNFKTILEDSQNSGDLNYE